MSREFDNDGANYLDIGDVAAIDITGLPITVSAWVRPDVNNAEKAIVTKYDTAAQPTRQYTLEMTSAGKPAFATANGSSAAFTIGATTLSVGVWQHICGYQTATNRYIYLNGVQDASATNIRTMINTTTPLLVGRYIGTAAPWDGLIAEIGIWNIDLSPAEIAALAKGVSPLLIRPQSLKGYWPLWGTGSPERDYSGQGNAATMNGTVNAGDRHAPVMPFVLPMPPSRYGPVLPGFNDAAEIYLDLQPSGVELAEYIDAATVPLAFTPSGIEGLERTDAATVYLDLQPSGFDIFSPLIPWWDPLPEGENKWFQIEGNKWRGTAQTRFVLSVRGRL